MEIYKYVDNLSRVTAEKINFYYSRISLNPLYLYYRETNSMADGQLCASEDRPGKCWELADNRRIPNNMTVFELTRWISNIIRRLPILPYDGNI